jgi:poly(3-hydroxybutyrate) depolymerase
MAMGGAAKQQPSTLRKPRMPRSGRPAVDPDVLMHTIAARARGERIGTHVDHPRLRQVASSIKSAVSNNRALHHIGAMRNDTLTISGISAGAAMAIQFEYAFSSFVRAAGIVAGLPFYCAEGEVGLALTCMDSPELIDSLSLLSEANSLQELTLLDPLTGIKGHTVRMFSGTLDTVVAQGSMRVAESMYQLLGVSHLNSTFTVPAEHSWVTDQYGNACSHLGTPYVNNCAFDFAGMFLRDAFANLNLPFNATRNTKSSMSNVVAFDQTAYGADPSLNSMATSGYLYIPPQCSVKVLHPVGDAAARGLDVQASQTCHVHINFHGCLQNAATVGLDYIQQNTLNEWADSNNIVILYPQVASDDLMNPNSCFDWWGYAGGDYMTKTGPQMVMIRSMVENLMNVAQI